MSITTYDIADLPELSVHDERPGAPVSIGQCTGEGCTRMLVSASVWEKMDAKARDSWRKRGYYKVENTTRCRKHAERVGMAAHNAARRSSAEREGRFVAGKYRGFVREGFRDPIGEIAFELKCTVEYVQRLLRRAGQPYERRDERKFRRDAIIEEIQFFHSMGRGVGEICEKVGMTRDQLAENMRHWKSQGIHEMDLDWLDTHDIMVYRNGYTVA